MSTEDRPDDPLTVIPPTPVDHHALTGPVAKERREDIQIMGWLQALTLHGALQHPVSVGPGGDPPDRILRTGGFEFAVELTEITIQQMRERLARVRQVGRLVEAELGRSPDSFAHLAGRVVQLSDTTGLESKLDITLDETVGQILETLREDRGYVGEGVDLSNGLPERWPEPARGFYGSVGPFTIQVPDPRWSQSADGFQVVAASQGNLRLSELRSLFWDRVLAKDKDANGLLLVTAGLVDPAGYMCPLDKWIFGDLQRHGVGPAPIELQHLDAVVVHHFGTEDSFVAYQRDRARVPWAR